MGLGNLIVWGSVEGESVPVCTEKYGSCCVDGWCLLVDEEKWMLAGVLLVYDAHGIEYVLC